MRLAPFSPEYLRQPARTWARLHRSGVGARFDDDLNLWLINRHALVRQVLADHGRFGNGDTIAPIAPMGAMAAAPLAAFTLPQTVVAGSRPAHARIRGALRAGLHSSPRMVDRAYRHLVRRRVDHHVDRLTAGDPATDLCGFTDAVALGVLADIVDLPAEDVPAVRRWTRAFPALMWSLLPDREQSERAGDLVALWRYCQQFVAARTATGTPADTDLVTRLLLYRGGNDAIVTLDEIAGLLLTVLTAGWQTTTSLLAHCLEHALVDRNRWRRLIDNPNRAGGFVEEALRISPPLDGWIRTAHQRVTLDGVDIPAGARCLLLLGAANHDPTVFTAPQRFNPERGNTADHLAFGHGIHGCPGAGLARLHAATVLQVLTRRLPQLHLTEGYVRAYRPNLLLRAHTALPADTGAGTVPITNPPTAGERHTQRR